MCRNFLITFHKWKYALLRYSMSSTLNPPDSAGESNNPILADESTRLRRLNRTPRPYSHEGIEVLQNDYEHAQTRDAVTIHRVGKEEKQGPDHRQWRAERGLRSAAGSESGTEADDERSGFAKALPPASLRPRKGLKTGEKNEDTLLTPSQLEDDGRRLQQDYFGRPHNELGSDGVRAAEQEKFQRRRMAEFVRRSSEVALMGVMIACVLCGQGVVSEAWKWRWELVSHMLTVVILILAYPVKLSIVDTQAVPKKLWQRFRVPASFDPATVLYPPLLPVLVALSVSANNPAVILPNVVLGLASLPQRLFPRSSRLGGYNMVHWLVSIIPLIAPRTLIRGYVGQVPLTGALSPEVLVSLYPLHHALLLPLHYLTKTSLLVTESHLLSAALINLLLLVQSPQMVILKACLWIGGATLLVLCGPVLNWNLTLVRMPRWKFRRAESSTDKRRSLVDAVSELINLQRAVSAFKSTKSMDSDADEDEPCESFKEKMSDVSKATEQMGGNGSFEEQHWNLPRRTSSRHSSIVSSLPWYLRLTQKQAERRKLIYAGYVYAVVVATILGPVRQYVSKKALGGQEPILWALGYMIGQVPVVLSVLDAGGLRSWVTSPPPPGDWRDITFSIPLNIEMIRTTIGPANVRLLLIGYWAAVLLAGLLAVFSLSAFVEVDTRRKVFHGTMVAMLLPSIFFDPCSCALALGLGLTVFLLLEVIRAGQVPPLGNAIGRFVAPYVDGRDLRGPVVVSHIFLLIGCAVPLWFSLASIPRSSSLLWAGWELSDNQREVAMLSGVICVGMGDAAASLIGRRYGRHKWIWVGGKSLEGSAAFAVTVTIGLLAAKAWQAFGGWSDTAQSSTNRYMGAQGTAACVAAWLSTLLKAGFCACGASFMEAVLTGANDNVVVPVALWLLVKGLRV